MLWREIVKTKAKGASAGREEAAVLEAGGFLFPMEHWAQVLLVHFGGCNLVQSAGAFSATSETAQVTQLTAGWAGAVTLESCGLKTDGIKAKLENWPLTLSGE